MSEAPKTAAPKTESTIQQQIDQALDAARTMRDQIRVDLHLAGMELKDRWNELEPKLADAERMRHEISEAAVQAAASVSNSFREFREALARHGASRG